MKTNKYALIILTIVICTLASCTGCNRVKPNFEGVLMENYGRNGKQDFHQATGTQGFMWPSEELYQVPMWEQKADPQEVGITAKDGGFFKVDPTFTYQAIRGKAADIIFNYKHVGLEDDNMMDRIEDQILNPIVLNAYREEARSYSTDSLLNHVGDFEKQVEGRLVKEFENKYFLVNSLTSGLKPPQSMVDAIEKRNNAIQQAEQVKNELQISEMQLQKARIDAERDRVQSAGLTKEILTQQWIEAFKTTQNKVIVVSPDGRLPILLNQ